MPSLATKETRLRDVQWKGLHNIYPTNTLLWKMKVRDDQMCSYCNDVVDYTEHFFFDCPTIQKFWNDIEKHTLIIFDIQTRLTVADVLFGIKHNLYFVTNPDFEAKLGEIHHDQHHHYHHHHHHHQNDVEAK